MLGRSALRADCAALLASQGRLRCRSQAALPRRCIMASRRSVACGAGLPLALLALQAAQGLAALPLARHGQSTGLSVSGLASSPPQKSPTPDTAHRAAPPSSSSINTSVRRAKPWSGVRRQRHCAALSTAERVAARAQRALQHLTRVDCSSTANAVSGASFDAGHAIEERKGVGPQGRPPYTSAGAYPAAALPRSVSAGERTEMLSRTADHLFWMSRYMERAENTARMLDVNYQTS